jgi:hypothetical protein
VGPVAPAADAAHSSVDRQTNLKFRVSLKKKKGFVSPPVSVIPRTYATMLRATNPQRKKKSDLPSSTCDVADSSDLVRTRAVITSTTPLINVRIPCDRSGRIRDQSINYCLPASDRMSRSVGS